MLRNAAIKNTLGVGPVGINERVMAGNRMAERVMEVVKEVIRGDLHTEKDIKSERLRWSVFTRDGALFSIFQFA